MGNEELPVIQYIRDDAKVFSVPYYDVGDFFETTNPTNPSERWKYGTWELYGKGKMTICIDTNDTDFNSAGKAGGGKSHNHGLTSAVADIRNWQGNLAINQKNSPSTWNENYITTSLGMNQSTGGNNAGIGLTGNTDGSNNMPPYIVVYRWIRTA